MSEETEMYRGAGVTVRFDGRKCVHSRNCVLGDPRVFEPNAPGPWIHPDAASIERVVELVHACPSGALTYERTDGEEGEQPPVVNTVRVRENGPLALHAQLHFAGGEVALRATPAAAAPQEQADSATAVIRRRASPRPVNRGAGITTLAARGGALSITTAPGWPAAYQGEVSKVVSGTGHTLKRVSETWLCRCGHSANKPYCDGTHKKIGFKAQGGDATAQTGNKMKRRALAICALAWSVALSAAPETTPARQRRAMLPGLKTGARTPIARLTAENGWLTLVGLYWFEPGENTFGRASDNALVLDHAALAAHAGTFLLDKGAVRFTAASDAQVTSNGQAVTSIAMAPDTSGEPTILASGTRCDSSSSIASATPVFGSGTSPARCARSSRDSTTFRSTSCGRFTPSFIPYNPVEAGADRQCARHGRQHDRPGLPHIHCAMRREWRLDALLEDPQADELFIYVCRRDEAVRETYGAGRFLYLPLPEVRRGAARLQQGLQPAVRVQRVRDLSAAAATESADAEGGGPARRRITARGTEKRAGTFRCQPLLYQAWSTTVSRPSGTSAAARAAARVSQLAQRLRFDLADALASHVELLADFFQRVVGVHVDAEAHAQHAWLRAA